jgi:transposase
MMSFFAGVDWGSATHAVCVVDAAGKVVVRFEVGHTAAGIADLLQRLSKIAPLAELRVAIERPSGLVVDTLVDAGCKVVAIHPNVLKACRPRYRAAGGKDDLGDAYIIADVLRTDGHRFRDLLPLSDEIKALRALVRTRDDLVASRVAYANQIRSLLDSYWPGAVRIFANIDSPIALAFLARYPTPASVARLGERRLASFLGQQGYPGRRSAAELLARLREAPSSKAGEAEADAKGEAVLAMVGVLRPLVAQLHQLTLRIEHDVAALADGQIVMSFPRAGRINAAQILTEIGDERGRFVSAEHLAAEAGVVPVTNASGKHCNVVFRFACNSMLRRAVCIFADNSRHESAWAASVYKAARTRGCDHPHAVRILARAWIHVLWRAWQDRKPYEPDRHRAAAKVTPAVPATA